MMATITDSQERKYRPLVSVEINTATRSLHTTLNKLIVARLPLSLPPHSSSPDAYVAGLRHFAHIFLTFESLWHNLARPPSPNGSHLSALLDEAPSDISPELHGFLYALLPTGLMRSRLLLDDLAQLEGKSKSEVEISFRQYGGDKIEEFCRHIETTATKPWVLVAYAWVFYMAIFSGGRWIRGELLRAGPTFWLGVDGKEGQSLPLSFFHFPGEQDGEDIKKDFKARLLGAEEVLTEAQREDVVNEAKAIFECCIATVEELDDICATHSKMLDVKEQKAVVGRAHLTHNAVNASGLQVSLSKKWPLRDLGSAAGVALLVSLGWYAYSHLGTWV